MISRYHTNCASVALLFDLLAVYFQYLIFFNVIVVVRFNIYLYCNSKKIILTFLLVMLKGLVGQLSLLRSINTRLTDENDLRDYGAGSVDSTDEPASIFREMEEASAALISSKPNNQLRFFPDLINEEFEDTDSVDVVFDLDLPNQSDNTVNN